MIVLRSFLNAILYNNVFADLYSSFTLIYHISYYEAFTPAKFSQGNQISKTLS